MRVSISIDGSNESKHDQFRNVPGAFKAAMDGIRLLRETGFEFQINTTVTRHNVEDIKDILDMTVRLGAVAHHLFLLVYLLISLVL